MKKGVIVYITGKEPDNFSNSPIGMINTLKIPADQIEFISRKSGHFDIHGAAWKLMASGMQHIVCMTATFTDETRLKLTGKNMKFCG